MLPYSIVVDSTTDNPFRVLRGGRAIFVSGANEMVIEDVPEMKFDISTNMVMFDMVANEYIDDGPLHDYRLWCFDCSRWYLVRAKDFPETCVQCEGAKLINVTGEQFALRGYPVSISIGLHGHHLMQYTIHQRYQIFYGFIPFQNTPESVPNEIIFSDVEMHDMNDLSIVEINKYGFKYRVTATGKKTVGLVAFNWEAVNG